MLATMAMVTCLNDLNTHHDISEGMPLALLLHEKADTDVPDVASVTFVEKATQLGAHAEFEGDADMPHAFCNFGHVHY